MDRSGFLRSLGLLVGGALIPDEILPITDFIEKKSEPKFKQYGQKGFINHMTIQRKTVSISGNSNSEVIWVNYCDSVGSHEGWINYAILDKRMLKSFKFNKPTH